MFPLVAGLLASTLFRTLVVRERVIEYRTDRVSLSLCECVCTYEFVYVCMFTYDECDEFAPIFIYVLSLDVFHF